MWLISPSIQPYIFVVLIVIGTYVLRRIVGGRWLFVFWLVSAVLPTGGYVIWIYYVSPLSLPETHWHALFVALTLWLLLLFNFGVVMWIVAVIVPPRTEQEFVPSIRTATGPPIRARDSDLRSGVSLTKGVARSSLLEVSGH